MKKLFVSASFFFFFLLATVAPAFAQEAINPCPEGEDAGGVGFGALCNLTLDGGIIGALITVAFIIAVLIALGFLIFGGIRWITSGGDKTKVEEARGTIVAALVGLILVFLAFFIINFVLTFFNLGNVQELKIPNISGKSTSTSLKLDGIRCSAHPQCSSGVCEIRGTGGNRFRKCIGN